MRMKDKLARYVFRRFTDKQRAQREFVPIAKAKTIGILYDATHRSQAELILKFAEELKAQGKNVITFGFFNKKKTPPDIKKTVSNEIISRADLNWYGIPKKSEFAMMANEPFDILINLYLWHCIPLLIVSASSRAKFRIGRYFNDAVYCFDFMINTESSIHMESFLIQVQQFLNRLKP
jgi:hypothetical protein